MPDSQTIHELFNERAAHMQYDAGLSRELAEQQALGEMVRRYGASVRRVIIGTEIPKSLTTRGVMTGTAFAKFRESVAMSEK